MSTSSISARSLSGSGQPGDQLAPRPFGIDPLEELSDLVRVQVPPSGQPPQLVLLLAVLLAVRGVDVPGDAEHPGPRGALAWIEGPELADHRDERVRGEIRYPAVRRAKYALTASTFARYTRSNSAAAPAPSVGPPVPAAGRAPAVFSVTYPARLRL
jgi:hypothetical protein